MKRFLRFISASWLFGGLLIILAAAMAMATFIENDYGSSAARALVYNAWWFELIFLVLAINMIGNIVLFRMGQKGNWSVLLFHLSFLIIIMGAAITRYFGYEGTMHIRENEQTSVILSTDACVNVRLTSASETEEKGKRVFFSTATPAEFKAQLKAGGQSVVVKSVAFIPNAVPRPIEMPGGRPMVGLVVSGGMDREEQFLELGDVLVSDSAVIGFEPDAGINCQVTIQRDAVTGGLMLLSQMPVSQMRMGAGNAETLAAGQLYPFEQGLVYDFGQFRMALSRFFPSAELQPVSMPGEAGAGFADAVVFRVTKGEQQYQVVAYGKAGVEGKPANLTLPGDMQLTVSYGSRPIELPFSLHLNDFILERYPGSESPSSYTSKVVLNDPGKNVNRQVDIFMNNILNYRGYRFYQSSYDADEQGTILSVNHDAPGTLLTYIGYFLMSMGMFWALFSPKTRFRMLIKRAGNIYEQRKRMAALLLLFLPLSLMAQQTDMPPAVDASLAKQFGSLWVQDNGGRIKPLNSLHQEVVVKLVKHNSFKGLSSDQVILGLLTAPAQWQSVPMITVKDPQLKTILGITGKKAAFRDFFTSDGQYKIHQWVDGAYRQNPASRNKLEQELIKVDEQVNVYYMAQQGALHRLFPSPLDLHTPWYGPGAAPEGLSAGDSLFVTSAMVRFIEGVQSGKVAEATELLNQISLYQQTHAGELLPSATHLKLELLYNRLNIFLWLATFFFALGGILLLLQLVALLKPAFYFKRVMQGGNLLLLLGFIYHTFGLVLRWIISGHAPWSNGYESMIFIGWAILLAGFLMSRKSNMVLPITGLFAGIVLMVAHLSWMNPEITNLVPVLKSYWLTLHVAIIIGGYGFLALGALLGFLNLLITVFKTGSNYRRLQLTIDELTAINEMALTAGLYLMTIGSFLGGVWANESWGRYWGWDPKETWSLITVVLYAFVVHMRLIPGLRGFMALNIASLITFASVIMTYLGVNYYLTGLHSYAGGDPVPIPAFVYYSVVVVAALIAGARYRQGRMEKEGVGSTNYTD